MCFIVWSDITAPLVTELLLKSQRTALSFPLCLAYGSEGSIIYLDCCKGYSRQQVSGYTQQKYKCNTLLFAAIFHDFKLNM